MGGFKEYDQYDAIGLGELVNRKEISPAELLDEAINRMELLNPKLNAVVLSMVDIARKTIAEGVPEGIFKGVPFLIKDGLTSYKGVRMTNGSKAFLNHIPDYDSEIVTRFKKSGLVIFGKTNMPEFGLMGVTEPELFGPARNPWNLNHTPGGSSGGASSAVAGGIVPMASGNDGGGSIRIPASCCGLFGLKPSRGRNPSGPRDGRLWQGAATEGVISRSVRDSAAMLDRTNGPDPGAPFSITAPEGSYLADVDTPPGVLKIAFSTRSPLGTPVHPECEKAVKNAAKTLEALGHIVEEKEPAIDGVKLAHSYFTMYYGTVAATLKHLKTILGRKARRSDVEMMTWTIGLIGRTISAGDLVEAINEWDQAARITGRFHETTDIYITPTLAYPPLQIGELNPKLYEILGMKFINAFGLGGLLVATGMPQVTAIRSLQKTPFTQLPNLTGQPAMTLPLHMTPSGLPVGVQFIARTGDERSLFRLAGQIEKAHPWFDRRPPALL